MKIGIIGGTGWLGGAIARALLDTGFVVQGDLWLSNTSGRRDGFEDRPDVMITTDNRELVRQCDIVCLSVLPQAFPRLDIDIGDRLAISVMAGVTSAEIASRTGARRVVRSLPNAAAELRQSFTPWVANAAASAADRDLVQRMFTCCGEACEIGAEAQLDYFTGLTGSGPAFLALVADAMVGSAVGHGIDPATAEEAVRQLFRGGGRMVTEAVESPGEIVRTFVDYAGTTAAGLTAMIEAGVPEGIGHGLDAAFEKARQGMSDAPPGSG
jgi:pyrroline-5-carboxylate reductase